MRFLDYARKTNSEVHLPMPGVYAFLIQTNGSRNRIHLRIDPDNSGLLLINASKILHLNPTAALMAFSILSKRPERDAISLITRTYMVSRTQARKDYILLSDQIRAVIDPEEEVCPVCDLDLEIHAPFSAHLSAPYRMDCALTYRCNNACAHCYNARPRSYPELTTTAWKNILDKIWEAGIPHVVFTGGEPTLRDDLPELIAYAEKNGQITGINTNGRKLADQAFVESLLTAGLDHVQITIESHNPAIHDAMVKSSGAWNQTVKGIQNVLDTRLFVMTNTTLLRQNSPFLSDTLDFLGELKVPTIGLNALIHAGLGKTVGTGLNEQELPALLRLANQKTTSNHQKLIWYTPTMYCHFDPTLLNLGVKGCSAALYNMCVESDGKVIPCQSYYEPLGDILTDSWDAIWNHPLATHLRERKYLPSKCQDCLIVMECGGGCPLEEISNRAEPDFVSTFEAVR